MKMLILLVVAVGSLVSSVAEGRNVTKCELKSLLEAAGVKLPNNTGMTEADFIAKIVCHVEKTSHFDTSVVTHLAPDATPPPRRGKRSGERGGKFSMAKYGGGKSGGRPGGRPGGRSSSEEDSSGEKDSHEKMPQTPWTLYGLFQLSDHLVCSSGAAVTHNLCQMNCTDLIDDNISDDISCLETIKQRLESGPPELLESFKRTYQLLFQKECFTVVSSTYFASC